MGTAQHSLRQAAAMGDLGAVQTLLTQALAPKGVQVEVQHKSQCLYLALRCPAPVPAAIALTLLSRELVQWPTYPTFSAIVSAYHQDALLWETSLDLTSCSRLQKVAQGDLLRTASPQPSPAPPLAVSKVSLPRQDPTSNDWQVVVAGIGLALLVLSSEQVTFLLSPLITLVHELGHAFTAWLFGYPAIPAFDFRYGGGVTLHGDRVGFLVVLLYAGLAGLAYYCRHHRPLLIALGVLTAIYTLFALSPIHEMLFVAMGHGFELLFAMIFLYRALSGWGCRYAIERPLYAMLGFFIVLFNMRFAWQLQFNDVFRELYLMGKGGIDHDLVRLARDFFHTDLATVVGLYGFLVILAPVVPFVLYRYRSQRFP